MERGEGVNVQLAQPFALYIIPITEKVRRSMGAGKDGAGQK
jgi:hypothetical protein